jgi:hypothetical protein
MPFKESSAMETVSIRNLRGKSLRENALKGKPLAITNRGALIGVIIPVTVAWVEHLVEYNLSRVRQSMVEGEQAMATGTPIATIQDVVTEEDAAGHHEGQARRTPQSVALTLAAAIAGGTVAQTPESEETLERLRAELNPSVSAAAPEDRPSGSSVITVRIGDLTAGLIEKAGANGQTLAITHDRQLIGIVIPVTRGLVEFLIEQNMSRVLYNIALSEKQIGTQDKMTTLDEALDQVAAEAAPPRPVLTADIVEVGTSPGR